MLLTLVKFNDGGKIYLENIDGDTFGFRFTYKISMGLHLGYKISLKNFVMFMWVRPKGISLIPGWKHEACSQHHMRNAIS